MKKLVSLAICLALVLAVVLALPQDARAATVQETGNAIAQNAKAQDGTFPATLPEGQTYHTAYCYACGKDAQWKPLTAKPTSSTAFANGDHYYLPKDVSIAGQLFQYDTSAVKTLCIHTNGKTLTDPSYRIVIVNNNGTLNIMGGGAIKANTKNNRGVLYANGACNINVYGTTIQNTATENNPTYGNAVVCLYNTNAVASFWGCTLKGCAVSPSVLTNGVVNLYNCTLTGQPAQIGNYANQSDSKAKLNLVDTNVIAGVDFQDGALTVSGATRINSLTLASGKTLDPSGLTAGASIAVASEGTITAAGKSAYAKYFTSADSTRVIDVAADGTISCFPKGAVLISADGSVTTSQDVLADWATGNYSYIRLYGGAAFELADQELVVDLRGSDLTVTGKGSLKVFDSANDTYDATACGMVINNGDIAISESFAAPNGNNYVTVTEENRVTAHRISISLNTVTLRTTAAGLYYKAAYNCDKVLSKLVKNYGVVLSLYNMPGADFMTEQVSGNHNAWTEASAPFQSGVVATSGSVFGILKDSRTANRNNEMGRMKIYANAYIDLGNGPIVANTADAGKVATDEGFNGTALSLYDVMQRLDQSYSTYPTGTRLQLDAFYSQWKEKGMGDWGMTRIGTTTGVTGKIDNSDIDLQFAEGTTDAVCPVCNTMVTWTAFVPATGNTSQGLKGHYYLTDDVTFTGSSASGIFYNGTKNTTLCFHLNGHNLTATATRAIFGSSGRVNVMGNGIVTGFNTAETGSAVQTNNSVAGNGVYLYGGTYKRASGTNSKAAVIGTHVTGGEIHVYEGATIQATSSTMAVQQSVPTSVRNSFIGLYGCTVTGQIVNKGSNTENGWTSKLEMVGCTVNGTVEAVEDNVYVAGDVKISSVDLADDVYLQLGALTEGASIGIAKTGIFAEKSEYNEQYKQYFKGASTADIIYLKDGALYCGRDYLSDLQFAEGTTEAMCPVCGSVKTWVPVDGSAAVTGTKTNTHYYLTQDIEFTGAAGDLALINPAHGTHTVCIHLNGHNFTGTNTRFLYGATCVTNVMGNGTVSGVRSDKYPYGSTIQINVANVSGAVNLYGGTYTQGENGQYTNEDYVISLSNNGSNVNIYEDAKVVAGSNGKAVYMGESYMVASSMIIRGTVEGDVYVAAPSKTNPTTLTLDNCTINGTVTVSAGANLTIGHAAKIKLLNLAEGVEATLDSLTTGADIIVKNEGIFTKANTNAQLYRNFFSAYNKGDKILLQDNQLRCKTDYLSNVYPDANGKAYCPVCKKDVIWTAVSSSEEGIVATNGAHYYLTADIVYEKPYDGNTNTAFFNGVPARNSSTCLHLNGHNITSTKSHGIFTGWGLTNIMGDGVISGSAPGEYYGNAVQINNSSPGSGVHLYSGTYRSAEGAKGKYVAAISTVGGGLYIYEDANIVATNGNAIWIGQSGYRDSNLEIYGATIPGGILTTVPSSKVEGVTSNAKIVLKNATIDGIVDLKAGNDLTVEGLVQINKLQIAAGEIVNFVNLKKGTAIGISADGFFSDELANADTWIKYLTCADAGDWIVVRDDAFIQEVHQTIPTASESDETALNTTYAGMTVRYGDTHNHTNSGPLRDDGTGTSPSTGADGKNSLEEWIADMDRLSLDFAFIVDHGQSIHMYEENFANWKRDYFIGGTEPGTTITSLTVSSKSPHYNMLFTNPEALESIFFKWESKYKPVQWNATNYPTANNPYDYGYRIKYPSFTMEEMRQLAKDVYDAGGMLVHVHPKYSSYIVSDDPMDYYFGEHTGLEITTGSGGNMMASSNNKAYNVWVELLNLGKQVVATAGSDRHRLPDISGLTTIYTANDDRDDYMAAMRAGNVAPGWVGIRMNVNGTAMGGQTSFDGQRLQFTVGDIYQSSETDYVGSAQPYMASHTYRVELYDDGGILMTAYVNPTEMNYFAIDCDASAMYYRVVVWDETDNERIGVSNPIYNAAYYD